MFDLLIRFLVVAAVFVVVGAVELGEGAEDVEGVEVDAGETDSTNIHSSSTLITVVKNWTSQSSGLSSRTMILSSLIFKFSSNN